MKSLTPLTGRMLAAARALAGIGLKDLATVSGVTEEVLRQAESKGAAWVSDEKTEALVPALAQFGVMLINEGDGMGAGVRLKFTRQDVRQIIRLEGEGGLARSDDVP